MSDAHCNHTTSETPHSYCRLSESECGVIRKLENFRLGYNAGIFSEVFVQFLTIFSTLRNFFSKLNLSKNLNNISQ
jgi:hypothetical protein